MIRPRSLFPVSLVVVAAVMALCRWADLSTADESAPTTRQSKLRNPIPADPGSLATGKQIFAAQCETCHGAGGKGDGASAHLLDVSPADLTSPRVTQQSDGSLFWKVSHGLRPMPTFSKLIPDDARWNVINYIRTLPTAAPVAPAAQPAIPDHRSNAYGLTHDDAIIALHRYDLAKGMAEAECAGQIEKARRRLIDDLQAVLQQLTRPTDQAEATKIRDAIARIQGSGQPATQATPTPGR
jgi:mono/diheme cytochrome c family protein